LFPRRLFLLAVSMAVLAVVVTPPCTQALAEGLSPEVTYFGGLAALAGAKAVDPGFRISSLEVDMRFDPEGGAFFADYIADVEVVADRLRDIEDWVFWPVEQIRAVTVDGVPVPVNQGTPNEGTYSVSLPSVPLLRMHPRVRGYAS
jgi:hypothetical protein